MAIFEKLEVRVTVHGQSLKEFIEHRGDEADSEDKIIRYVEAVSGAEFQILFDALDHTSVLCGGVTLCEGLTVDVYVDGRSVEYLLLMRESAEEPQKKTDRSMEEEIAMLGVIKVVVKRVISRIGESYIPEGTSNEYQEPPAAVPESKLKGKAISHRTKFGQGTVVNGPAASKCVYIDSDEKPYATFELRYCSRKALQDMLIIPHTPHASRTPRTSNPNHVLPNPALLSPIILQPDSSDDEEAPLESLSRGELIKLCRKRKNKVKAEPVTKTDRATSPPVRIKRERSGNDEPSGRSGKKAHKIKVISLLDDE